MRSASGTTRGGSGSTIPNPSGTAGTGGGGRSSPPIQTTVIKMELEWREKRSTGKIHIFKTSRGGGKYRNRNPIPICGEGTGGAYTYPVYVEDVLSKNVCKKCMKHQDR